MQKSLVFIGIAIVIVVGVLFYLRIRAKSLSPEGNVDFKEGNLNVHVFYNRPYKRGRAIFGKLIPYGKTWRTGANEPTTFETNEDLKFGDKELKAGKYSLWTVPNEQTWQVVFNSDVPFWGISFSGEAQRKPASDVLVTEVPVNHSGKVIEQFTISVGKGADGFELVLLWDQTIVAVPFVVK